MFTNNLSQRSILNSSRKKVGSPGKKKKRLNQIVHLCRTYHVGEVECVCMKEIGRQTADTQAGRQTEISSFLLPRPRPILLSASFCLL